MKRNSLIAILFCLFIAAPVQAQFNFGVKGGVNFSDAPTNITKITKANGRAGFFIGPMARVTIPMVGLGLEADILYSQTGVRIDDTNITKSSIEIPILLRYDLTIPGVKMIFVPFVAVGPQFGVNVGSTEELLKDITTGEIISKYEFEKTNMALNVGLGATLLNKVQIQANYNIDLGKTANYSTIDDITNGIIEKKNSKSNIWQISLAYIF